MNNLKTQSLVLIDMLTSPGKITSEPFGSLDSSSELIDKILYSSLFKTAFSVICLAILLVILITL